MKKYIISGIIFIQTATPCFALFVNGGFETGDATGWTFYTGNRVDNSEDITWSAASATIVAARSEVISNSSPMQTGQVLDVDVYDGTYMLRLSDYVRGKAKKVTQTDTIDEHDIADGMILQVNWGAMLANPEYHDDDDQPYFKINVIAGIDSYTFDAFGSSTAGWLPAGNNYDVPLYYKSGSYELNLASYTIGTTVTVEMIVSGCSLGGHGSWAYLDGIEIVPPPPNSNPVPEPASLILFGTGLAGLAAARRRKKVC